MREAKGVNPLEKLDYDPPALTVFGAVAELTKGGPGTICDLEGTAPTGDDPIGEGCVAGGN